MRVSTGESDTRWDDLCFDNTAALTLWVNYKDPWCGKVNNTCSESKNLHSEFDRVQKVSVSVTKQQNHTLIRNYKRVTLRFNSPFTVYSLQLTASILKAFILNFLKLTYLWTLKSTDFILVFAFYEFPRLVAESEPGGSFDIVFASSVIFHFT